MTSESRPLSGVPIQGSASYLPHLLNYLTTHPDGFPFDKQIFVGLLICLISQRKNLIVEVENEEEEDQDEEDHSVGRDEVERRAKEVVERVVRMTELISTSIFGLHTRPIRLSSRWSHQDLPTRIAFPRPLPSTSATPTHLQSNGRPQSSTLRNRRRSSTFDKLAKQSPASAPTRTTSKSVQPESPVDQIEGLPSSRLSTTMRTASNMMSLTPPTPILPARTTSPGAQKSAEGPGHITDRLADEELPPQVLLTASPGEESDLGSAGRDMEAIASGAVIRPSGKLGSTADGRVDPHGVPSNRPQTSITGDSTFSPHPTTAKPITNNPTMPALPRILIVHNVDRAIYDAQVSLYQILHDRSVEVLMNGLGEAGARNEEGESGVQKGAAEVDTEGEQGRPVKVPLDGGFCCVWVRRRGFRNKRVPTFLLDKFSFSCAASYAAIDGTGPYEEPIRECGLQELIPREHLLISNRLANKTHLHPPLRLQISDLISATLHHPRLRTNISSTATLDIKDIIRVSRILFRPFEWKPDLLDPQVHGRQYDQRRKLQEAMEREDWYATDEDVRMVWGNLINHRVELRTEEEEVWAVVRKGGRARLLDRRMEGVPPMVIEGGWEERGVSYEATRGVVAGILKHSLDVV